MAKILLQDPHFSAALLLGNEEGTRRPTGRQGPVLSAMGNHPRQVTLSSVRGSSRQFHSTTDSPSPFSYRTYLGCTSLHLGARL